MYLTENLKFHLAENLKFLREQNGKTQGELAVLFGIEQKTISSWECGSRKPPIGTIVSLAKLYRVWATWKKMKELFCHKFMTEQELEPYRLQEKQCTILILEGVELKDENTENGACNKA